MSFHLNNIDLDRYLQKVLDTLQVDQQHQALMHIRGL
jgi:hypothetical protein